METRSQRFGSALRRARVSLDLTQEDLAEALGWDPSTISKYEGGKRKGVPEPEEIRELEIALELTDGSLQRAAGYQVELPGDQRHSLSYGGAPLTPAEEQDVLEYIEFKRSQRRS